MTDLRASFAGAASTAGGATSAVASAAGESRAGRSATPAADAAISYLDVFVTGLGEDSCKPEGGECLKRQKSDIN